MSLYDDLRDALQDDRPVALATIIDGPGIGQKLLVGPDREPVGTLGNEDLDRVVSRDALGQLLAGRTDRRTEHRLDGRREARRLRPGSPRSRHARA